VARTPHAGSAPSHWRDRPARGASRGGLHHGAPGGDQPDRVPCRPPLVDRCLRTLHGPVDVVRHVRDGDQQNWRRCVGASPLAPTSLTHFPLLDPSIRLPAPGTRAAGHVNERRGHPAVEDDAHRRPTGRRGRARPRSSCRCVVDGAGVPEVATGRGARESVWIGPARRHALSVRVTGLSFYLADWAMSSGSAGARVGSTSRGPAARSVVACVE
jgi:hypothetical protein